MTVTGKWFPCLYLTKNSFIIVSPSVLLMLEECHSGWTSSQTRPTHHTASLRHCIAKSSGFRYWKLLLGDRCFCVAQKRATLELLLYSHCLKSYVLLNSLFFNFSINPKCLLFTYSSNGVWLQACCIQLILKGKRSFYVLDPLIHWNCKDELLKIFCFLSTSR